MNYKEKIVVMGGSFNPPTIAHLRLMLAAVDGVGAEFGYFVPTSHAYLKRKMRRAEDRRMCLPEDVRHQMLSAMCQDDRRLRVSDVEFGTFQPHSFETMVALQRQHADAELLFVIGEDKLEQVPRWRSGREFLGRFGYVVFNRGDGRAQERLAQMANEWIRPEKFFFVTPAQGLEAISSTEVRRRYFGGEDYAELIHPGVQSILGGYAPSDFPLEIEETDGTHNFLSNRYPCAITIDGHTFATAEAAYCASMCCHEADKTAIALMDPGRVASVVNRYAKRDDWQAVRLDVMGMVIREKFRQHPELAERLRQTGRKSIVATHSSRDTYWGVNSYTLQGENNLGKILMKVREELT